MKRKSFTPPVGAVLLSVILALLISLSIESCKSTQNTAEKKRQQEIEQLQKLRKLFPCDTVSSKADTVIRYARVKGQTFWLHDTLRSVDTLEKTYQVTHTKIVVDSAAIQELNLRLISSAFQFDQYKDTSELSKRFLRTSNEVYKAKADELSRYKTIAAFLVAGLFLSGVFFLIGYIRSKIV